MDGIITDISMIDERVGFYRFSVDSVISKRSSSGETLPARRAVYANVGIIISTLATLSGILSVLLVINYNIVPELQAHGVIYTNCRVKSLAVKVTEDKRFTFSGAHGQCLVPVLYQDIYGIQKSGWLVTSCDKRLRNCQIKVTYICVLFYEKLWY